MRTLITSIALLILIIVGWIYVFDSVENTSSSFVNNLNILNENINSNDWKEANIKFSKIEEKWNKTRDMWSILLDHHEIDNIDLAMSKASQYLKSKNTSLSLGEIETLIKLFNIVMENQDLTLTNVL